MAILSRGCKPDNFEPHNSLKLSFTNIRGLRLNFIECESFLESNSPDILALCETNLDTGLISRKLCRFLLMFSTGFTSLIVLLLFPLSITFFIFVHGFDSISSNIDEILSINSSAVFVFVDFNVHHKDWLTYFGGTDRHGELL